MWKSEHSKGVISRQSNKTDIAMAKSTKVVVSRH